MKVAVIGAGSFGTCLATLLADNRHEVQLWCRDSSLATRLQKTRINDRYLPGIELPASIQVTTDLASTAGADMIVGVTPSRAIADVFSKVAVSENTVLVNASKGLDPQTLEPINRIYERLFSARVAKRAVFLSGPTFAKEIVARMPSAAVFAGADPETVAMAQRAFSSPVFRGYASSDVTGVLIGGALKNVVAIAAGVSDGIGLGLNARAALITRGLAEIARIGAALGAEPLTFSGLSGLGDLVLTCSGDLSRNRQVGLKLGAGKALDTIKAEMNMIAEGVGTTKIACQLADRLDVDAPIARAMHGLLFDGVSAKDALGSLMSRALTYE